MVIPVPLPIFEQHPLTISLIVAMGKNQAIGLQQQLPWRLKSDLQRFKEITLGHHLIMGRKTYESIGRPLPGRDTIIVTRQDSSFVVDLDHVHVVHNLEGAFDLCRKRGEQEVFVCGGGQIYEQAMDYAHKIYLTTVDYDGDADTFFPKLELAGWEITHEQHFEKNPSDHYASCFQILEKRL
jgi:dihydrofolate reductase